MGFLLDAAMKAAAAPVEPVQLELTLRGGKAVPPECGPPRYYRVNDRMLSPRFFHGTVEGPITEDGKFEGQTVIDPPPAGTMMRFNFHHFEGDRFASGAVAVLAELTAFEAWERYRVEVEAENQRWRDMVGRATKENAAR